jgi:hypothetical protein
MSQKTEMWIQAFKNTLILLSHDYWIKWYMHWVSALTTFWAAYVRSLIFGILRRCVIQEDPCSDQSAFPWKVQWGQVGNSCVDIASLIQILLSFFSFLKLNWPVAKQSSLLRPLSQNPSNLHRRPQCLPLVTPIHPFLFQEAVQTLVMLTVSWAWLTHHTSLPFHTDP